MKTIKLLDQITINKIAAGEVIDRPASIVKELIENSLDAKADSIKIEIEDGGKKLIKVTDNGSGITKEDLKLAPIRHATSKISSLEDIYQTLSFGFRGEALASICHVALLEITSKTKSKSAYYLRADQNNISEPELTAHNQGTTISVKDLFLHIPVRRKFLKTANSESSYITDIIQTLSIIHPNINFTLIADKKETINTTGISDQKTLLITFFGKDIKDSLININTEIAPIKFIGHISAPSLTYPTRAKQIVSVNGRLIKSGIISKAISQSFYDIVPAKRFPLVVLDLTIPQNLIDVNIHPQKTDIKYLNPGFIFDLFPKIIRANLNKDHSALLNSIKTYTTETTNNFKPLNYNQDALSFLRNTDPKPNYSQDYINNFSNKNIPQKNLDDLYTPINNTKPSFPQNEFQEEPTYFQILDTYIVIKGCQSLWLVDQHAAHERILYEKIKASFGSYQNKQALLISETIELTPDLYLIFQETKAELIELGFEIEDFGINQIVIRSTPVEFTNTNISILIQDILARNKENVSLKTTLTNSKKDQFQMSACKAAIKAGKKMTTTETTQLIKDLTTCPANYTCPHGRPLFIELTKSTIEKLFLRQ
jgi:DNA mismatch repair protein MutL